MKRWARLCSGMLLSVSLVSAPGLAEPGSGAPRAAAGEPGLGEETSSLLLQAYDAWLEGSDAGLAVLEGAKEPNFAPMWSVVEQQVPGLASAIVAMCGSAGCGVPVKIHTETLEQNAFNAALSAMDAAVPGGRSGVEALCGSSGCELPPNDPGQTVRATVQGANAGLSVVVYWGAGALQENVP